jgi:mannose-1-phosphate guanylyltransferase
MKRSLWVIVLAGGSGSRLQSVTGGVPKQFWRPDGTQSLLESTLERFAPLTVPDRRLVVVDDSHRKYVTSDVPDRAARLVFQPENRGTGAGLLLGLVSVLTNDPDAVVLVTPSDHGVRNEGLFQDACAKGVDHIRAHGGVLVFGVRTDHPGADYGWLSVLPQSSGSRIVAVSQLIEKPAPAVARNLFASGALVNTSILVARGLTLLDLYRSTVPDVGAPFVGALTVPSEYREQFLRSRYGRLGHADLSRDVLARARGVSAYNLPGEIGWTDLGTPTRLQEWLSIRHSRPVAGPPTPGTATATLSSSSATAS